MVALPGKPYSEDEQTGELSLLLDELGLVESEYHAKKYHQAEGSYSHCSPHSNEAYCWKQVTTHCSYIAYNLDGSGTIDS